MLQSLQKYQDPPLYLFEDFFGPIIGESRAIIIQCCFNQEHPDLLFEKDMLVTSVNGCHSPDEFLRKLTAMADASIAGLFDTLQHLPANTWPTHVEYVNTKLRVENPVKLTT